MEIHEKAAIAARYLTRKTIKRTDSPEKTIVTRTEDAPEWMQDLCHKAHGDMLPDDHAYEFIEDALDLLADEQDISDLEADIYTHDLLAWLASRNDRLAYLDEVLAEAPFESGFALIQAAQLKERAEIFGAVEAYLEGLEDEELAEPV